MKRIGGIVLLALVLCTGIATAQEMTVIGSAGLNWGIANETYENGDSWMTSNFFGLSFNVTAINSYGLALMADLSISLPYLIEGGDDLGNTYEIELSEFETVYNINLMGGIGFAPINNDNLFFALTVGPDLHIQTYKSEYWFNPDETITQTTTSFGLAANIGTGFNFGGGMYIVINIKGGYNFFGSYYTEIEGDSDTDKIDDFGMPFVVPSVGIGLKL